MLEDNKNTIKGLWSIILSVPVFVVVLVYRDVQDLVTYTGGLCGSGIMLTIPCVLVFFARKQDLESKLGTKNENRSPYFGNKWLAFVLGWNSIVVITVLIKLFHKV